MPTSMVWIYALPTWLFFLIVLAVFVGLSTGGLLAYRRLVPPRDEVSHNDVAGPIVGTIGTILAVILSFLLIGNWQEYDSAGSVMATEASSIADVYHAAEYFPAATRDALRSQCRVYVDELIADEWPAMRQGGRSNAAGQASLAILKTIAQYQPQTQAQQSLQQSVLGYVNQFQDNRRARLFANEQGIPIVFWAGNLFLAAVTIGFCYLFRVRNEKMHLLMTAALAAVIATLMVIIAEFDYPFRGDGQIPPWPFVNLQHRMADPSLD
ncbi:MAG: DUF4239 domain-containing protein [Candidatus Eremiobacteraeota bacterium]|nr:DUF4239 domain-containing protein [Candidatus Eremiobacteraeota bacterium]